MDFVPLRIKTVQPDTELSFDLYIYYKDHYLCYAERGNALTTAKLEKLINQDMADFYVPEEQVDNVTLFLDETLNEAVYGEGKSLEERVDVVSEVAAQSIERMNEEASHKNYDMTQKAASSLRTVIKNNHNALKKLFGQKTKESDLIINHSINVCALATRLGEHLRFKEDEIDDLATAALLHDIGLTKLKVEDLPLFEKDATAHTPDERLRYSQHIKLSQNFLNGKDFISKRVEDLVNHHEEDLTGLGPLKVRKLTPLQECLSLCNAFDKRLIVKKESPKEAYKVFQLDYIGRYNLELIQRFEAVLVEEGLL
jgi:HD-GYP domain-containing protein (c-di-GMP phosphodiesterase class II)